MSTIRLFNVQESPSPLLFIRAKRVLYLEIEWAPLKCLFWKANDSIMKLMISITSGISLWHRSYKNMFNYGNDKKCRRFYLSVEQILVFDSIFFYLGFLSQTFFHFQPLHGHLDINRVITAKSSPLRIAWAGLEPETWFPSASRYSLNYAPFG